MLNEFSLEFLIQLCPVGRLTRSQPFPSALHVSGVVIGWNLHQGAGYVYTSSDGFLARAHARYAYLLDGKLTPGYSDFCDAGRRNELKRTAIKTLYEIVVSSKVRPT